MCGQNFFVFCMFCIFLLRKCHKPRADCAEACSFQHQFVRGNVRTRNAFPFAAHTICARSKHSHCALYHLRCPSTQPPNHPTITLPNHHTIALQCLLESSHLGSRARPQYVISDKNEPGAVLDRIRIHLDSPLREPCSTCTALSERGRNVFAKAFTSDRIRRR